MPHPPYINDPFNSWRSLEVCRRLQQTAAAAAESCEGPLSEGVSATFLVVLLRGLLLLHLSLQLFKHRRLPQLQLAELRCASAEPSCRKVPYTRAAHKEYESHAKKVKPCEHTDVHVFIS